MQNAVLLIHKPDGEHKLLPGFKWLKRSLKLDTSSGHTLTPYRLMAGRTSLKQTNNF
jgi:hypothetical protein